MAKEVSKELEYGNFQVTVRCIEGDVGEELSDLPIGKVIIPKGVKSLRYRENVGRPGEAIWRDMGRSADQSELLKELADLKQDKKDLEKRLQSVQRRLNSYELTSAEEDLDAIPDSI